MESAQQGKVQLGKYNNSWYKPGSFIKRGCWYWVNAFIFQSALFPSSRLKRILLRCFGASVGKAVVIKPLVSIKYPWHLKLGDHCWIGERVWIDNLGRVELGHNVCISQGALLLCGNHNYNSIAFDLMVKPIVLEDGVWIGAKALLAPGVVAGTHAVVTAGSVAIGRLDAYGIYTGNPANQIKKRTIQ